MIPGSGNRSAHQKKIVLLHDPENDPEEAWMEFRLTYDGPLFAAGNEDDKRQIRRQHKHELRRAFHLQLERLWEITPFLKSGERSGPNVYLTEGGQNAPVYDAASLAAKNSHYGFHFVPLVTEELGLICGLDVLLLRPGSPGKLISDTDIDNRLKTLFDALRIPVAGEEYVYRTPAQDEEPMYCLLENDKLITKLAVETDQLLQFSTSRQDLNEVKLVITVRLRPYEMHLGNMPFG